MIWTVCSWRETMSERDTPALTVRRMWPFNDSKDGNPKEACEQTAPHYVRRYARELRASLRCKEGQRSRTHVCVMLMHGYEEKDRSFDVKADRAVLVRQT